MPPFDYNAPAELFLAKRTKSSRENYRRSAEPSALGCRLETSASIVLKSNACTKTVRARLRNETDGVPLAAKSQDLTPIPSFQKRA